MLHNTYKNSRMMVVKICFIFFCINVFPLVAEETLHTIEMPALGRPFRLGNIYNARTESIMGGGVFLLWNYDKLVKNTIEDPYYDTEFKVKSYDNLDDKLKLFGLSGSLELALASGKLKVSGSAKYLEKDKKTNHEASVAMKIQKILFRKRISPVLVKDIDYPKFFDKFEDATHVVTEIMYGGSAVFNFQKLEHNVEKKKEMGGSLELTLKMSVVSGNGSVNMTFNNTAHAKFHNFTCDFKGDLALDIVPTNIDMALKTVQDIPKMINKNTAVPISVVMAPISLFDDKYSRMVREIARNLLKSVKERYKRYSIVKLSIGDLRLTSAYKMLTNIRNHVDDFKIGVDLHKARFDKEIVRILPKLRGVGGAEDQLLAIINDEYTYNMASLKTWIDRKSEEGAALNTLCEWDPSLFLTQSGAKRSLVWDPTKPYLVLLVLNVYQGVDQFTTCLKRMYENITGCNESVQYQSWLEKEDEIKRPIAEFIRLYATAQRSKPHAIELKYMNGKQLVYGEDFELKIVEQTLLYSDNNPRAVLELYKGGDLIDSNAEFPLIENLIGHPQNDLHSLPHDNNDLDILFSWTSKEIQSEIYPNNSFVVLHRTRINDENLWSDWLKQTVDRNNAVIKIWKNLFTYYKQDEDFYDDPFLEVLIVRECLFLYCGEIRRNYTVADMGIWWKPAYDRPLYETDVNNVKMKK